MYLFGVFIVLGLFGLEVTRMNLKMAPIAGLVIASGRGPSQCTVGCLREEMSCFKSGVCKCAKIK